MTSISLRDEVQKALGVEWQAFQSRHPRLAAVIDQTLLMERAVMCIADDPAFREAIEQAAAMATSAEIIEEAVKKFIGDWIVKLF
jgi:hypothetical protein